MSKYPIHYYKKSHHYSDDMTERRDREAFALIMEGGAVEGWRTKALSAAPMFAPTGYYGGIEIHSREPLYEGHQQADFHCDLINANCYHDGSSMAFDHIERLFDLPEGMFTVLRSWQPDEWQVVDAEVVTEISKTELHQMADITTSQLEDASLTDAPTLETHAGVRSALRDALNATPGLVTEGER